jgi:hypothetical protein
MNARCDKNKRWSIDSLAQNILKQRSACRRPLDCLRFRLNAIGLPRSVKEFPISCRDERFFDEGGWCTTDIAVRIKLRRGYDEPKLPLDNCWDLNCQDGGFELESRNRHKARGNPLPEHVKNTYSGSYNGVPSDVNGLQLYRKIWDLVLFLFYGLVSYGCI